MDTIELLLVSVRLVLIIVFLVSSITKLINQQKFFETLANFGIPIIFIKIIGVGLPWIELS